MKTTQCWPTVGGRFAQVAAMFAVLAACGTGVAQTQTLAEWTFTGNTINPTGGVGSGTLSLLGGATASFASGVGSSDPTPDGSVNRAYNTTTYPSQGNGSGTAGVRFNVPTTGFNNIIVTFDQRHSNTSSRFVRLDYTTDGTTFVTGPVFEATTGGDTWYNGRTLDLSSISGASNNPSFGFRVVSVFAPPGNTQYAASTTTSAYGSTGTLRFDNVRVTGVAAGSVPPSGTAAVAPGAVCRATGTSVLTVTTQEGQFPVSAITQVVADLSAFGLGSAVQLTNQGGNTWTTNVAPLAATEPGPKTIPITVRDAANRTGTTATSLSVAACDLAGQPSPIVISQVYGGAGAAGELFQHDYVELFNRSNRSVNVSGWSVQYASSNPTGAGFNNAASLSGSIPAGGYYLVRMGGSNASPAAPLPTPDAVGITDMSSTQGRVALVTDSNPILADCAAITVLDLVNYGSTQAASCSEGGAPAPGLNVSSALFRLNGGCQDTVNNAADFATGAPAPRNSATPARDCSASPPTITGVNFSAAPVCNGDSVTITVNVAPGSSPPSTGLTVTGNLSSLGGSNAQAFTSTGPGTFSFTQAVPASNAGGDRSLSFTVADAQGRNSSFNSNLFVNRCVPSATAIVEPRGLCTTGGTTRLVVFVNPANFPAASTGLTAAANLSAFGLSATQQLFDDGTNGDRVANDNAFSFQVNLPAGSAGDVVIPFTITDAESRSASASATFTYVPCTPSNAGVVISQIYGGGGNTGAILTNDFVELHNRSTEPVSLEGWTLQYASAGGVFSGDRVNLSGSIQPGGFYLVQLAAGSGGILPLPTPDATGTFGAGNTAGKFALVRTATALGTDCTRADVEDLVGYGSAASCFEGSFPAAAPNNTLAIFRLENGCQDNNQNSADWFAGEPAPRNSASPVVACTPVCRPDYNGDGALNTDDISDFITDYFTVPEVAGPGGYARPCAGAPAPYDTLGYKVDFNFDCVVNTDDISDFITAYFQGC